MNDDFVQKTRVLGLHHLSDDEIQSLKQHVREKAGLSASRSELRSMPGDDEDPESAEYQRMVPQALEDVETFVTGLVGNPSASLLTVNASHLDVLHNIGVVVTALSARRLSFNAILQLRDKWRSGKLIPANEKELFGKVLSELATLRAELRNSNQINKLILGRVVSAMENEIRTKQLGLKAFQEFAGISNRLVEADTPAKGLSAARDLRTFAATHGLTAHAVPSDEFLSTHVRAEERDPNVSILAVENFKGQDEGFWRDSTKEAFHHFSLTRKRENGVVWGVVGFKVVRLDMPSAHSASQRSNIYRVELATKVNPLMFHASVLARVENPRAELRMDPEDLDSAKFRRTDSERREKDFGDAKAFALANPGSITTAEELVEATGVSPDDAESIMREVGEIRKNKTPSRAELRTIFDLLAQSDVVSFDPADELSRWLFLGGVALLVVGIPTYIVMRLLSNRKDLKAQKKAMQETYGKVNYQIEGTLFQSLWWQATKFSYRVFRFIIRKIEYVAKKVFVPSNWNWTRSKREKRSHKIHRIHLEWLDYHFTKTQKAVLEAFKFDGRPFTERDIPPFFRKTVAKVIDDTLAGVSKRPSEDEFREILGKVLENIKKAVDAVFSARVKRTSNGTITTSVTFRNGPNYPFEFGPREYNALRNFLQGRLTYVKIPEKKRETEAAVSPLLAPVPATDSTVDPSVNLAPSTSRQDSALDVSAAAQTAARRSELRRSVLWRIALVFSAGFLSLFSWIPKISFFSGSAPAPSTQVQGEAPAVKNMEPPPPTPKEAAKELKAKYNTIHERIQKIEAEYHRVTGFLEILKKQDDETAKQYLSKLFPLYHNIYIINRKAINGHNRKSKNNNHISLEDYKRLDEDRINRLLGQANAHIAIKLSENTTIEPLVKRLVEKLDRIQQPASLLHNRVQEIMKNRERSEKVLKAIGLDAGEKFLKLVQNINGHMSAVAEARSRLDQIMSKDPWNKAIRDSEWLKQIERSLHDFDDTLQAAIGEKLLSSQHSEDINQILGVMETLMAEMDRQAAASVQASNQAPAETAAPRSELRNSAAGDKRYALSEKQEPNAQNRTELRAAPVENFDPVRLKVSKTGNVDLGQDEYGFTWGEIPLDLDDRPTAQEFVRLIHLMGIPDFEFTFRSDTTPRMLIARDPDGNLMLPGLTFFHYPTHRYKVIDFSGENIPYDGYLTLVLLLGKDPHVLFNLSKDVLSFPAQPDLDYSGENIHLVVSSSRSELRGSFTESPLGKYRTIRSEYFRQLEKWREGVHQIRSEESIKRNAIEKRRGFWRPARFASLASFALALCFGTLSYFADSHHPATFILLAWAGASAISSLFAAYKFYFRWSLPVQKKPVASEEIQLIAKGVVGVKEIKTYSGDERDVAKVSASQALRIFIPPVYDYWLNPLNKGYELRFGGLSIGRNGPYIPVQIWEIKDESAKFIRTEELYAKGLIEFHPVWESYGEILESNPVKLAIGLDDRFSDAGELPTDWLLIGNHWQRPIRIEYIQRGDEDPIDMEVEVEPLDPPQPRSELRSSSLSPYRLSFEETGARASAKLQRSRAELRNKQALVSREKILDAVEQLKHDRKTPTTIGVIAEKAGLSTDTIGIYLKSDSATASAVNEIRSDISKWTSNVSSENGTPIQTRVLAQLQEFKTAERKFSSAAEIGAALLPKQKSPNLSRMRRVNTEINRLAGELIKKDSRAELRTQGPQVYEFDKITGALEKVIRDLATEKTDDAKEEIGIAFNGRNLLKFDLAQVKSKPDLAKNAAAAIKRKLNERGDLLSNPQLRIELKGRVIEISLAEPNVVDNPPITVDAPKSTTPEVPAANAAKKRSDNDPLILEEPAAGEEIVIGEALLKPTDEKLTELIREDEKAFDQLVDLAGKVIPPSQLKPGTINALLQVGIAVREGEKPTIKKDVLNTLRKLLEREINDARGKAKLGPLALNSVAVVQQPKVDLLKDIRGLLTRGEVKSIAFSSERAEAAFSGRTSIREIVLQILSEAFADKPFTIEQITNDGFPYRVTLLVSRKVEGESALNVQPTTISFSPAELLINKAFADIVKASLRIILKPVKKLQPGKPVEPAQPELSDAEIQAKILNGYSFQFQVGESKAPERSATDSGVLSGFTLTGVKIHPSLPQKLNGLRPVRAILVAIHSELNKKISKEAPSILESGDWSEVKKVLELSGKKLNKEGVEEEVTIPVQIKGVDKRKVEFRVTVENVLLASGFFEPARSELRAFADLVVERSNTSVTFYPKDRQDLKLIVHQIHVPPQGDSIGGSYRFELEIPGLTRYSLPWKEGETLKFHFSDFEIFADIPPSSIGFDWDLVVSDFGHVSKGGMQNANISLSYWLPNRPELRITDDESLSVINWDKVTWIDGATEQTKQFVQQILAKALPKLFGSNGEFWKGHHDVHISLGELGSGEVRYEEYNNRVSMSVHFARLLDDSRYDQHNHPRDIWFGNYPLKTSSSKELKLAFARIAGRHKTQLRVGVSFSEWLLDSIKPFFEEAGGVFDLARRDGRKLSRPPINDVNLDHLNRIKVSLELMLSLVAQKIATQLAEYPQVIRVNNEFDQFLATALISKIPVEIRPIVVVNRSELHSELQLIKDAQSTAPTLSNLISPLPQSQSLSKPELSEAFRTLDATLPVSDVSHQNLAQAEETLSRAVAAHPAIGSELAGELSEAIPGVKETTKLGVTIDFNSLNDGTARVISEVSRRGIPVTVLMGFNDDLTLIRDMNQGKSAETKVIPVRTLKEARSELRERGVNFAVFISREPARREAAKIYFEYSIDPEAAFPSLARFASELRIFQAARQEVLTSV